MIYNVQIFYKSTYKKAILFIPETSLKLMYCVPGQCPFSALPFKGLNSIE